MDKKIKQALEKEKTRQQNTIMLIASENYVSKDILKLQGSVFTNKYAEGYPGKRYYAGCQNVDVIENLAIEYACKLFKCKYANVQPHSGSSANMAAIRALINHGDKILSMKLSDGGHLTHGHPISFSGQDYEIINYAVNKDGLIDYDELEKIALKEKPKLIIAGASAYARIIDFKRFGEIAKKVNAYLMVDIAHIAGLVATNLHPSPFPYADIVTSTTHKTLRGPRGGIILTNDEEIIKRVNKTVFPGIQGGPLMHVIAAKAQCLYEALQKDFIDYQKQILKNARALSEELKKQGFKIITGGTDNHLILVDVKSSCGLTGKEAEDILTSVNIICNKNAIPFDEEPPSKASGIRLGTPAMTTLGLKEKEFKQIAILISEALCKEKTKTEIKKEVKELLNKKASK
ncbi:MAG TPA: serine hydroxymethyltransferase [Bacilli bacterium]|nr:serine hydroxymethyltransferase [Bacilli bacterium]